MANFYNTMNRPVTPMGPAANQPGGMPSIGGGQAAGRMPPAPYAPDQVTGYPSAPKPPVYGRPTMPMGYGSPHLGFAQRPAQIPLYAQMARAQGGVPSLGMMPTLQQYFSGLGDPGWGQGGTNYFGGNGAIPAPIGFNNGSGA